MQITPMAQVANAVQEAPQTISQKIRSMRMKTNVTTGRVEAPAELPIPDATNDQTTAATEETQPLSPQLAALAREKRALQVRERAIAEREKAAEAQAGTPSDAVPLAQLKSDPLGVLLGAGVTYEQLTEAVLANQNGYNPEIAALKAELKALKGDVDKTFTDRDTQSRQQAVQEITRVVSRIVSQGDEFEAIRDEKAEPQVVQYIEEHYDATGEILDESVACKKINDWLINDALRKAKWKQVQSQFAPETPAQPPQQQRQMRTLTNRDGAQPLAMDRRQRALLAWDNHKRQLK